MGRLRSKIGDAMGVLTLHLYLDQFHREILDQISFAPLVCMQPTTMASVETVKQYLAYWFQLGKRVVSNKTSERLLPEPVFRGGFYSQEFDECWQKILRFEGKDCYLEGTTQTIAQLLTPMWDIMPCAMCSMPVPKINLGIQPVGCPCDNLNNWPNNELPLPRKAINTKQHLQSLRSRLSRDDR